MERGRKLHKHKDLAVVAVDLQQCCRKERLRPTTRSYRPSWRERRVSKPTRTFPRHPLKTRVSHHRSARRKSDPRNILLNRSPLSTIPPRLFSLLTRASLHQLRQIKHRQSTLVPRCDDLRRSTTRPLLVRRRRGPAGGRRSITVRWVGRAQVGEARAKLWHCIQLLGILGQSCRSPVGGAGTEEVGVGMGANGRHRSVM